MPVPVTEPFSVAQAAVGFTSTTFRTSTAGALLWADTTPVAKSKAGTCASSTSSASKSNDAQHYEMPAIRHRDYFFADGNVVLQVEDTLYNLHRSLLERHSPIFREMFLVPQPDGSTEGLSEDHPIMLSGICAINFTRLLWLLYPPVLGPCRVTTVDEWVSIVDQADRWQMDSLREYAITQLRQLYIDPIRKIILWNRYDLPVDELVPAYMELISRPHPLSLGEAQDVGLEMFVKIASARETAYKSGLCKKRGYSSTVDAGLHKIVKDAFGLVDRVGFC